MNGCFLVSFRTKMSCLFYLSLDNENRLEYAKYSLGRIKTEGGLETDTTCTDEIMIWLRRYLCEMIPRSGLRKTNKNKKNN